VSDPSALGKRKNIVPKIKMAPKADNTPTDKALELISWGTSLDIVSRTFILDRITPSSTANPSPNKPCKADGPVNNTKPAKIPANMGLRYTTIPIAIIANPTAMISAPARRENETNIGLSANPNAIIKAALRPNSDLMK